MKRKASRVADSDAEPDESRPSPSRRRDNSSASPSPSLSSSSAPASVGGSVSDSVGGVGDGAGDGATAAPCPDPDNFSPNASIALVGLRGVGKSTIGVMLSASLRRRLIDGDVVFVAATGMSIDHYVRLHGWASFRAREAELMATILRDHGSDAVIVCPSGCVETAATRVRLQAWMRHHPVVHIVRNEAETRDYLRPASGAADAAGTSPPGNTFHRLVARRQPMYSSCSNLVFYNMWDKQRPGTVPSGDRDEIGRAHV